MFVRIKQCLGCHIGCKENVNLHVYVLSNSFRFFFFDYDLYTYLCAELNLLWKSII